jgi:hypothetical protein
VIAYNQAFVPTVDSQIRTGDGCRLRTSHKSDHRGNFVSRFVSHFTSLMSLRTAKIWY